MLKWFDAILKLARIVKSGDRDCRERLGGKFHLMPSDYDIRHQLEELEVIIDNKPDVVHKEQVNLTLKHINSKGANLARSQVLNSRRSVDECTDSLIGKI